MNDSNRCLAASRVVLLGLALTVSSVADAASVIFSRPAREGVALDASLAALTFTPVKDAMVKEAVPASNFGTLNQLQVSNQAGYSKWAYLQFDVTGLPAGATNISAQLQVSSTTTGTGRAITAHAVASTSWSETAITWNTRLPMGTALSTVSSHTSGQVSVWDVSTHRPRQRVRRRHELRVERGQHPADARRELRHGRDDVSGLPGQHALAHQLHLVAR
jgi:hypothetical protein